MATLNAARVSADTKPRILRVFISYAREDEKIAVAIFDAVRTALGTFADVFIDNALQFGLSFQDEIKSRLDDTNVLIVVYSAALKPSHSFTGMELGYFMGVKARDQEPAPLRRIVPIYLEAPPDTLAENEGINIGISRSILELPSEEYERNLKIDDDTQMVRFLAEFQEVVDKLREENGFPKVIKRPEEQDLYAVVRRMQLSIFGQLKTNPQSVFKPQKQITIKTSDAALNAALSELPLDALLLPIGGGNSMSIFGLPDQDIVWADFRKLTKNSKFRDSWIDAITSVVTSSLQGQLDVDNSQLIVSNDGRHAFRVILTTGTRYFNGTREFNLYFVEYLRPRDFGDASTSLVLKALELCCRFRFLFFEANSRFSHMSVRVSTLGTFRELVRDIERELNLFRRDALDMGLDRANVWAGFVDWPLLQKMSEEWAPLDARIRNNCLLVREAKEDAEALAGMRDALASSIEELEIKIQPLNTQLICGLSDSLKRFCNCL